MPKGTGQRGHRTKGDAALSRKDLASLASAPHDDDDDAPYPASARPTDLASGWFKTLRDNGKRKATMLLETVPPFLPCTHMGGSPLPG